MVELRIFFLTNERTWIWSCDLRANERPKKNCTRWHILTNKQTDKRTWRLYDWIGPVGDSVKRQVFTKVSWRQNLFSLKCEEEKRVFVTKHASRIVTFLALKSCQRRSTMNDKKIKLTLNANITLLLTSCYLIFRNKLYIFR